MAHSVRGSIMIMGSAAALTYHTRLILNHLTSLSVPKIHVSFCASCSRGLYFKGFHRSPFGRLPEKKRFFQDAPCMVNPSIEEGETCVTEKVSSPSCTLASVSEGLEKNADTIDLNPPRGTRDFLPEDMLLRNWLFEKFREVSSLFAFEEVDFPLLESEELFVRKGGEEITQQLYNFEDKGGRRVALRPELTPSLARLVMQKGKALSLPIKWFSIGQCWRYERMTRGRRREHYQWNMDIMGIPGIEAEAELLSAIITFFMKVGITASDVGIKVSSRKVLQALLDRYSISKDSFPAVCVIVDKIEKLPAEDIRKELKAIGITPNAAEGILQDLSLKSLRDLEGLLGRENEAVLELKELFSYANYYGYSQWLHFDASVVRGLAYYTGIVFEGFDHERKLRAICGGGRYDHLLSTFGGVDVPACGFGFGDAVIMELLKEKRLVPTLCREIDDIVWPLRRELRQAAVMVASTLRNKGRNVDLILDDKRSKWAFKHAEKVNAKRMVVVGDDEWTRGAVRVKNLSTREERDIQISELS